MKLAEALLEKKGLLARANDLEYRYIGSAVYVEGEVPEEDVVSLEAAIAATYVQYEKLTVAINKTNNSAPLGTFPSIMEAIARRDTLKLLIQSNSTKIAHLRNGKKADRYTNDVVIKKVVHESVNLPALMKHKDDLAMELRILDTLLQATNWQVDLVE